MHGPYGKALPKLVVVSEVLVWTLLWSVAGLCVGKMGRCDPSEVTVESPLVTEDRRQQGKWSCPYVHV